MKQGGLVGMYPIKTISIIPRLPEKIGRLRELAYNLWFSWNYPAIELFQRINPGLWEEVYHNPVKFLLLVDEEELKEAAEDKSFLDHYQEVFNSFDHYMQRETWYDKHKDTNEKQQIAYFSAEFGVHESHPTYSGGLGLLAGDHCKAASDLGLPFVGIGLLYKHGYFTQRINRDGQQEAHYPFHDFSEMPITPVLNNKGQNLIIDVKLPGRRVYARVWRMILGRVNIYFLDASLTANHVEDRQLTSQLYGGDKETRISQEILLGRAGIRALRAMNIHPTAWHINEGHASFLLVERVRELVEDRGLPWGTALEAIRADTLFTTHTPVPAGHDIFPLEMVDRYYNHLYERLGITREQFLELGHDHTREGYNMTLLSLNYSGCCNAVSKLHSEVSRNMFSHLYKEIPEEEVPIGHVTNGIHTLTWLAPEIRDLMDTYLDPGWETKISDPATWEKIDHIPDQELWETHVKLKENMIRFARAKIKAQHIYNQETIDVIHETQNYLQPNVLTIGFARRFATYKRAGLLFKDKERLHALIHDPRRPIQFVFAGKAHPADAEGQALIKLINDTAKEENFRGKIVFLENYDINVSRYILQGVDVWLNLPRRPMEASGTSGMKAAINGVLNCSILDGWWPEAYNGRNGFVVGSEWDFADEESQDRYDLNSLYAVLKQEVLPTFYDLSNQLPEKWIRMMKESIKYIAPNFSTERMVKEYMKKYYLQAMQRDKIFTANQHRVSKQQHELKQFIKDNWHHVKITKVETNGTKTMNLGEKLTVRVSARLRPLSHENVCIEIVYGDKSREGIRNIHTLPLHMVEEVENNNGDLVFTGDVTLPQGTFGYTVRARPCSPYFSNKFELPLVHWAPSI